jgi:hypothetical protein
VSLFEETMLVKEQCFIDEAKKVWIHFFVNACDLLNCQKLFISVAFDGVCT